MQSSTLTLEGRGDMQNMVKLHGMVGWAIQPSYPVFVWIDHPPIQSNTHIYIYIYIYIFQGLTEAHM